MIVIILIVNQELEELRQKLEKKQVHILGEYSKHCIILMMNYNNFNNELKKIIIMNCKRKSAFTTKVGGDSTPSSAMANSLQLLSRWTFSLFFDPQIFGCV